MGYMPVLGAIGKHAATVVLTVTVKDVSPVNPAVL